MILVTGATGNVGTEVVAQLLDANNTIRVLTRSDNQSNLPKDVEVCRGDLNEPSTVRDALKHVRRVFLLGGNRDMPGLMAEIRSAGVEHVVLLSSRSVIGGRESNAIVKMWTVSEQATQSSGVPWTILRPGSFMSNALRWLPQLKTGNTIRVPFAGVPIAAIDPWDIAAVAKVALTGTVHAGKIHVLSGPAAILPADQVRILAEVLSRNLRIEPQSHSEARVDLSRMFPPEFVEAMFRFYADGEFDDSIVVPTVQEITGRHPRTFEQWARAHAQDFAD